LINKWLVAEPDPRSTTTPPRPILPTRRLMRVVSKDPSKTDVTPFSRVILQAGVDLYFRGRDPWTTRQLASECVRSGASVDLPLLSFDTVRVDVNGGDLSSVAKLRLALDASRDPAFLRAGVAALDLSDTGTLKFTDCIKDIPDSQLGGADPRAACLQYVHPLAGLTPKNEFKAEVQIPITFKNGKYAIVAGVAHLMTKPDAPHAPISVTLRAEPVSTPPGRKIGGSECGDLTNEYRSRCKTSDCFCIGNAYCEGVAASPPQSCEVFERDCYLFCLFQKDECDCTSFCDLLKSRQACQ
jgi:hypothetical protein